MLDEEERKKLLLKGLKEDRVSLKEKCDSMKHHIKKARKITLGEIYDRSELQTLDILTRYFTGVYDSIAGFLRVITILLDFDVHWTIRDGFYFQDMEKLGLIDDIKTFEKIKKTRKSLEGRVIIVSYTKLYEDIFSYAEILFKMAEKVEGYVKEKFPETDSKENGNGQSSSHSVA